MSDEKSGTATPTDVGHSQRSSSISEKSKSVGSANSAQDIVEKLDEPELLDETKADQVKTSLDDVKPVSVFQLFRFADKFDLFLTIAGTAFSCASGVVTPVMIIVFSELMGVILEYEELMAADDIESANDYLDHESRHYCLLFFILGIVMWVLSAGVNACWAIAAENQGLRIRKMYYKSIMRQDIGWFDTVKTGELTTRITNDVNLVQE
ncbi:Multidrug resistance protein 1, partial [Coemansia guatemalensis]